MMIIAGSVAACLLLVWVASTGLRVMFSKEMANPSFSETRIGPRKLIAGTRVVRFEDVLVKAGREVAALVDDEDYIYEEGYSAGWPSGWTEDLFLRRN